MQRRREQRIANKNNASTSGSSREKSVTPSGNLHLGCAAVALMAFLYMRAAYIGRVTQHVESPYDDGWMKESDSEPWVEQLQQLPCNIPRLSISTAEGQNAFNRLYRGKTAVLLTGGMEDVPARKSWSRHHFVERFGGMLVRMAPAVDVAYYSNFEGAFEEMMPLGEFMEYINKSGGAQKRSEMVFSLHKMSSRRVQPAIDAIAADAPLPEILRYMDEVVLSIGPSKAGLPSHLHDEAALAVIHGLKAWFIFEPGKMPNWLSESTFFSSPFKLFTQDWPKYKGDVPTALTCVQKPGEILVLPSYWHHATINIGEVVAVGAQTKFKYRHRTLDWVGEMEKQGVTRNNYIPHFVGFKIAHAMKDLEQMKTMGTKMVAAVPYSLPVRSIVANGFIETGLSDEVDAIMQPILPQIKAAGLSEKTGDFNDVIHVAHMGKLHCVVKDYVKAIEMTSRLLDAELPRKYKAVILFLLGECMHRFGFLGPKQYHGKPPKEWRASYDWHKVTMLLSESLKIDGNKSEAKYYLKWTKDIVAHFEKEKTRY